MQILAVMVRYRTLLAESQTLRGLRAAFECDSDLAAFFKVMVWDNSPEEIPDEEITANSNSQLPTGFLYRHSKVNLGPAGAFNDARLYAQEHGHDWMLLLDQDMQIHAKFLRTMLRHCQDMGDRPEVAAIAPTVYVGDAVVSPLRQLFNRHRPYPPNESGIAPGEARVINSGCLVRVSALERIGGFSTEFWLDYSDMYVFHQFFLHGMKVWRAADAKLQHEMTIMDYDRLMSAWRFNNFSEAETAFNDLYKGWPENAVQTIRLFVRAIKLRLKYDNHDFARIAWRQWLYRMTTNRKFRLEEWRAESLKRQADSALEKGPELKLIDPR